MGFLLHFQKRLAIESVIFIFGDHINQDPRGALQEATSTKGTGLCLEGFMAYISKLAKATKEKKDERKDSRRRALLKRGHMLCIRRP